MGRLRGTLTHCLRNPSFGLRRWHAIGCLRGGLTRTYADLNFAYHDIHMARLLHSMMTGVLERTQLYVGACILYVCSSVHSSHDQHLRMGATRPAFLSVNAWSDNIEGWILRHFTLAQCRRTNSFATYALAFTGKSNSKCLNVPYEFLHWRFSSLLNSETVCTLPCKEMQVQFHMLAGHGQWSWQQWFGAWGLSWSLL